MELPTESPATTSTQATTRRLVFGLGVREIGFGTLALGLLALAGGWLLQDRSQKSGEARQVRAQVAMLADAAEVYRDRFAALEADAARVRRWAEDMAGEPGRTWAKERARRVDALVLRLNQDAAARRFEAVRQEVEQLIARGAVGEARARLANLPSVRFPGPAELERLKHEVIAAPLAEYSRQSPAFYRALRQYEPEIARRDEAALRAEIAAAGSEAITPQTMLKVDLLASVAASDDPLVAEWSALTSAMDYFEEPDAATLGRWRRAQHAARVQDWAAATAEMQAILKSRVRTRQPFRAAVGRALLKSRPDNPDEAYPFLAEAAAAGDKAARAWVAEQDLAQKRFAAARRWLEQALTEGEASVVGPLVDLYAKLPLADAEDARRRAAMLERVTDGPEPPAAAWLALGLLYERGDPPGSSPAKAFASYQRAAQAGMPAAELEVARCAMTGFGCVRDPELACAAAGRALRAGLREPAAALLNELMAAVPAAVASAVQRVFEQETVNTGGGYMESRMIDGPMVSALKGKLARYFDQLGQFGKAAKLYAAAGDAQAATRRAELTTVRSCQACGGKGEVQVAAPCPTCGGKGQQLCSFCGGSGSILAPGAPPCVTCGGSGAIAQERRVIACGACAGTGKGKGSVTKRDCADCEGGQIRCSACVNGSIKAPKECPECRGRGAWSLAERAGS